MRNTVANIAILSLATGVAGFSSQAFAAEEVKTPLETKTDIQENAPAEIEGDQQQTQAAAGGEQAQQVVASVGGEDILRSDVMKAMEDLPPRVKQQPAEMLFPAVLDQLVTRELILEEARAANLQEDPEVQARAEAQTQDARERAMVQVWLRRELEDRVTDEQVQGAIDELTAANPQMEVGPGLTQQVKQALQVQAITDVSDELRKAAEVTYYGPTGQPVEGAAQVGQGAEAEQQQGAQATETEQEQGTQGSEQQ